MRRSFTAEEEDYLRKTYGVLPTKDIAETLGRTIGSISGRASALGLKVKKAEIKDGLKQCSNCGKFLPIDEFKYMNRGRFSESDNCHECRKDLNYQKIVNKKLEQYRKENGILSDEELFDREERKNEQSFTCSICGEELSGKFFVFKNKKDNELDSRCRKCRTKINKELKMKNILKGKCW